LTTPIDTLSHCRQYGRQRQYECPRGIKCQIEINVDIEKTNVGRLTWWKHVKAFLHRHVVASLGWKLRFKQFAAAAAAADDDDDDDDDAMMLALRRHLAPLRTDFTDTRTALRFFFSVSVFFNFSVIVIPSVLVFLSQVSYLSHNRLFLDFYFLFFNFFFVQLKHFSWLSVFQCANHRSYRIVSYVRACAAEHQPVHIRRRHRRRSVLR